MYVHMYIYVCIFFSFLILMDNLPNLSPSPGSSDSLALASKTGSNKDYSSGLSHVVTMAPYLPSTSGQRASGYGRKNTEKKSFNKKLEVLPGILNKAPAYAKYLTLSLEDFDSCDIFKVHRSIVDWIGREPKISPLGKGKLLVEVGNYIESERLKNLKEIDGKKVECVPHNSYNQSRGVIYAKKLMGYEEIKLQEEFKEQGVINVKRIMKKENGVLCPQPLLILTFNLLKLPETISAGWLKFKIRPYIPSPRRCFHCQMYGHVNTSCRKKVNGEPQKCINCGEDFHGECHETPRCLNCGGNHAASDKKCPVYLFEKEVITLKTIERISFIEAKERVSKYMNPNTRTYSASLKEPSRLDASLGTTSVSKAGQNKINKRSLSDDSIPLQNSKIQNIENRSSFFSTLSNSESSNNSSPNTETVPNHTSVPSSGGVESNLSDSLYQSEGSKAGPSESSVGSRTGNLDTSQTPQDDKLDPHEEPMEDASSASGKPPNGNPMEDASSASGKPPNGNVPVSMETNSHEGHNHKDPPITKQNIKHLDPPLQKKRTKKHWNLTQKSEKIWETS